MAAANCGSAGKGKRARKVTLSRVDKLDEQFDEIQQEAMRTAEQVKCSLPEFLEGLKSMRAALNDRISGVEEEVARLS